MHICFFSMGDWPIPDERFDPGQNRISRIAGDLTTMADQVVERSPAVVFIYGFEANKALIASLGKLAELAPSVALIPIVKSPDPSFLLEVMRNGVREVLASDSIDEMLQAISRIKSTSTTHKKGQTAKKTARRIGFMSAKGGDGGSFISANLAASLAQDGETRVLLVDLAVPFGDVEMYLSGDGASNDLSDITTEISRLDHSLLSSMVHHFSDNFDFIPSPRSFEKVIQLQPSQIDRFIDIAADNYNYLILDIGTGFDPITLQAIEKLDQLFLMVTQSVPSIRRAGQIMRLLESIGFSMPKLSVVVNKYSAKEPIAVTDIENALRKKTNRKFGLDMEGVRESIVKGTPYVSLFQKSELTRAIDDLAGDWLGKPKEEKPLWRRFGIK